MPKRKSSSAGNLSAKKVKSQVEDETKDEPIPSDQELRERLDDLLKEDIDSDKLEKFQELSKRIVKNDKKLKEISQSSIIFEKGFSFLLKLNEKDKQSALQEQDNQQPRDLSDLIEKFIKVLSTIEYQSVSSEIIFQLFEKFCISLIEINYVNELIIIFVSQIVAAFMPKSIDKLMPNLERILNECVLDESLIFNFYKFFSNLGSAKIKEIIEIFLSKILKYIADTKSSKLKPESLANHVTSIVQLMTKYRLTNRTHIYESIIDMFLNIKTNTSKYMSHKIKYLETEKTSINAMVQELIKNDSGSACFVQAFQSIFERYSVDALMNRFFYALFLSSSMRLAEQYKSQINQLFLAQVESFVTCAIKAKEHAWLHSCLGYKYTLNDLNNQVKYSKLVYVLENERATDGIISLALNLIDKYGVEINEHTTASNNLNLYLTLFASFMLEDLCKCDKQSREKVILTLLDKSLIKSPISTQASSLVYISQLEKLLKSKLLLKIYLDQVNGVERNKLNNQIISRLTGAYQASTKRAAQSLPVVTDKSQLVKNIIEINSGEIKSHECAVKLLNSICVFLQTSSKSEKSSFNDLVELLKKNCNDQNVETRKLAVLCLISLVKLLNNDFKKSFDKDFSFKSDYVEMRSGHLNSNFKATLHILELLKTILKKYESEATIRSSIYQSFYFLLRANPNLTASVVEFIYKMLSELVIVERKVKNKTVEQMGFELEDVASSLNEESMVYLNLDKCVSDVAFKLVEPVDVLLNCADLCTRLTLNQLMLISNNFSTANNFTNKLDSLVKALIKTYIKKDSAYLHEKYREQLKNKLAKQETKIPCLKVVHQLELGIIDAMIEGIFSSQDISSEKIEKILLIHESTANLISLEVESSLSEITKQKSEAVERKQSAKTSKRKFEADKENEPQQAVSTKAKRNKREPLGSLTNVITQDAKVKTRPIIPLANSSAIESTSAAKSTLISNLSFANIQFDHTPRISYTCCLKMAQLYLCSAQTGIGIKASKLFNDLNAVRILVNLIQNEKFNELLFKIIEKKFKAAQNSKYIQSDEIYDPESLDTSQLFDFFSDLWVMFCQRINAPDAKAAETTTIYKPNLTHRFNQSFLNRTHRYILLCQSVWSIMLQHFENKIDTLIMNERKYYAPSCTNLFSLRDSPEKTSKLYWTFLVNCSKTIQLHLSPTTHTKTIATRIVNQLLALMYDVLKSACLIEIHYDNFTNWLFDLASEEIAQDNDVGLAILKLLTLIANKQNTNAYIVKYVAKDYMSFVQNEKILNENIDEDESNYYNEDRNQQFNLLNQSNLMRYQQYLSEQIIDLLEQLQWPLINIKYFNIDKLFELVSHQLESIIMSLNYAIKSASNMESTDFVLISLTRFYQFMEAFLKNDFIATIEEDTLIKIKELIDTIAFKLQVILSDELNRMKELIFNEEMISMEKASEKTENDDIIKIIKYNQSISQLINSIDSFEQALVKYSDLNKDAYLLENYKMFLAKLKLNFENRIVRTISEKQLSTIVNNI